MNQYDQLPYPSLVYADTHPSQLASLAALFGLQPPPLSTGCQVLELGCADGTNLIAMAQTLPKVQFLGIDASEKQIRRGQHLIEHLGLKNIKLSVLDFTKITPTIGLFDYIIAHGLYSWITPSLQESLLDLCQGYLTEHGIAYLSYNVYPGWHLETVVRDMMIYHVQQLPTNLSAEVVLGQAKGILRFLAQLRTEGKSAFDQLIVEKWQQLQTVPEGYFYHDFLEEDNHPVYFYQFVERLKQQGLHYVTDIEFRHYCLQQFPTSVQEVLEELFQGDFLKQEQYLDFFYNRTLRRSLLSKRVPDYTETVKKQVIPLGYLGTDWQPADNSTQALWTKLENTVEIKDELTQQILKQLAPIYPQRIAFEQLLTQLSISKEKLVEKLLELHYQEMLEWNLYPSALTVKINSCPLASPLARWQVLNQQYPLINLRCEFIQLDPICVAMLPHLNGKNEFKQLVKLLKQVLKKMQATPKDKAFNDEFLLEQVLLEMSRQGLLVK